MISHHRTNVPDSISSREWIDISPKQAGKLRKGRLIGVEGEGKRMATVEAEIYQASEACCCKLWPVSWALQVAFSPHDHLYSFQTDLRKIINLGGGRKDR